MRFTDARAAGRALAESLTTYAGRADAVVVAVARGGVAVGLEVSGRLGVPLDLVVIRRLLVPRGPADPLCAAYVAGASFLDEELRTRAALDPDFANYLANALSELDERARACRGPRPARDLAGKTVLLIDNGVRTGSTLRVAARALRAAVPARIVAAAPVADAASLDVARQAADDFVCLAMPAPFGHVGLWYASFRRPSDEEIRAMLEESERG